MASLFTRSKTKRKKKNTICKQVFQIAKRLIRKMSQEIDNSTSFGFKKRNIKKPALRRKQESSEESGKLHKRYKLQ